MLLNLFHCSMKLFEKPYTLMFCVADASMYAHYLFNAFDTTNNGSIKFKVSHSPFVIGFLCKISIISLRPCATMLSVSNFAFFCIAVRTL